MNYGFVSLDLEANEVPITVFLQKSDPLYETKMKLINENTHYKRFQVVDTLSDKTMGEFLSWLRFVEFEGDSALLDSAKNAAISEAQA